MTEPPTNLTPLILEGHVIDMLRSLPAESVQCVVTSPPYWGLRDYSRCGCATTRMISDTAMHMDGSAGRQPGEGNGSVSDPRTIQEPDPNCEWCKGTGRILGFTQVWGEPANHRHDWEAAPPRRSRSLKDIKNPNSKQATNVGSAYDAVPHAHEWERSTVPAANGQTTHAMIGETISGASATRSPRASEACACGAWRGELGLEPTPELYVSHLADVFDEVRRVLREDGTCWVNLGDTYSGSPLGKFNGGSKLLEGRDLTAHTASGGMDKRVPGLKPKDLAGIPWSVALELRRRGWWLRSDCIWAKPNPMPESVSDRPSRGHEYVFMFTKAGTYYYDQAAVRFEMAESTAQRIQKHIPNPTDNPDYNSKNTGKQAYKAFPFLAKTQGSNLKTVWALGYSSSTLKEADEGYDGQATKQYTGSGAQDPSETKRRIIEGIRKKQEAGIGGPNIKTVWQIATQPYPDAHFATYPEELPRRCILLSSSEKGACRTCGAPWERSTVTTRGFTNGVCNGCGRPRGQHISSEKSLMRPQPEMGKSRGATTADEDWAVPCAANETTGWIPRCSHPADDPVPCLILDPFAGSGTTLQVARRLGRRSVGIELNPQYVQLARRRSGADTPSLEAFY